MSKAAFAAFAASELVELPSYKKGYELLFRMSVTIFLNIIPPPSS